MTRPAPRLMLFPVVAVLAGCVGAGDGAAVTTPAGENPLTAPVRMQEYVPGGGGGTSSPRRSGAEAVPSAPAAAESTQPRRRGGSGTPPDLLTPAAPFPPASSSVTPKDTTDDTARMKRDLMRPGVDDLKRQNDLGRLDPLQQRDLLNREQDLHRLQTDPLRR